MANIVVLGMQWGDEGKGKIVDLICPAFDAVVRFQGGHNAGHTVKFGDHHFALHFLPSGILHEDSTCVLGNGMVIEPEAFFKELGGIQDAGIDTEGRVFVSKRAQVILPEHVLLDRAREDAKGAHKIGTTTRGIGPCYETKASRIGLRIADLSAGDLERRLENLLAHLRPQLAAFGVEPTSELHALADFCRRHAERLAPMAIDTMALLGDLLDEGRPILFEGAQGALLDLDHGTYPYVTSSSTTSGGVCTGAGVPPTALDGVLGVIKAYTTRVGSGPFVGELLDERGEHLRRRGHEFGTTTGRPRRCAFFDAVIARYSSRLNGVDLMALTKLDVLDELEEIPVCVAYRYRGEELEELPAELEILEQAVPVYKVFPGWRQPTVGITEWDALPQAARDYVMALENEVGVPFGLVSTGPKREQTILLGAPELEWFLGERLDAVRARL
jgi:adenylosuccinate synthase